MSTLKRRVRQVAYAEWQAERVVLPSAVEVAPCEDDALRLAIQGSKV